jgi:hypothetical protein
MRKPVLLVLAVLVAGLASATLSSGQAAGVEFNSVSIIVPGELLGSFQTYLIPLNVSETGMLSTDNVYVLAQGVPRFSYLFSDYPPLVAVFERSAYNAVYEVWYGGGNPYSSFISVPGTGSSLWLVFDDFDYSTGFWLVKNASITGSRVYVDPGGYLALSAAYSPRTAHVWLVHGRKALVISLQQEYSGFIALVFTTGNFTDVSLVQDGSDVFFIDSLGNCLYYSLLHLDRQAGIMIVVVNPAGNTVIYMLYGGLNKCLDYRVS